MNSITSLFPSLQWCKKLMKLTRNQNDSVNFEKQWEEKAIESLVKKLNKRPDALETLELVLLKKCADTPCVTIPKTQDKRIQIHLKKIFPHVAYCKVWRWSDLKNHNELKQVVNCANSFYLKSNNNSKKNEEVVCINPYHYERVQSSICAASTPSQSYNQNSLSISNSSFASSLNQLSFNQSFNNQSLNDQSLNYSYYQTESPAAMKMEANNFYSDNYYDSQSFNQTNNVEMYDDALMSKHIIYTIIN